MNVFVSWRGSDREIKNTLVSALRNALGEDDRVWESDDDCVSNFSSECIDEIRRSQVFVVIVSDEAMKPSYVINEVIEARALEMRGLLNIVVYKITDSDYTPEFAANLNHISDANHVARMTSNVSGCDSLIKRVSYLLNRRRSNNPEKPYDVFKPELDGIPLGRSGYFVEHSRDDFIEAISEAFKESNVIFTTQLGGYGRRSAVRKYAELYSDEYEKIYVMHLFSGSMRDFFINGIKITNMNSNVFESLNENEIIQRKSSLLGKLDKRTLIIVPNLQPGPDDDSFVCDALNAVGCRIIFITEALPRRTFENFSVVSIAGLKNEYLHDLFFHYYDKADDEEREKLVPYLDSFFEKIEGHTKSVEITAKTLSGEYGVYPDDIPEILDGIKLDGENKLSKRIFLLISGMFEIQKFNDTDKTVLLVAAMTSQLPLDEKSFLSVLEGCDDTRDVSCWSESISRLIEHRWLTSDSVNRLISLEPFMASVCLAKIQPDLHLATHCLNFLNEKYLDSVFLLNVRTSIDCFKRLSLFFACVGNKDMSEAIMVFSKFFDDGEKSPYLDDKKIRNTVEKTKNDAECTGNSAWCEAVSSFCSTIDAVLLPQDTLKSLLSILLTSTDTEILKTTLFKYISNSLKSIVPSGKVLSKNELFGKLMNAFVSMDMQATLEYYYPTVNEFVDIIDELELTDDMSETVGAEIGLLQIIGFFILMFFTNNAYQQLECSRACFALLYTCDVFINDAAEYKLLTAYFYSLYNTSGPVDEADAVFTLLMNQFNSLKRTVFATPDDADMDLFSIVCCYIKMLVASDRTDDAERIYKKRISAVTPSSAESAESVLELCSLITNSYMAAGEAEKCTSFLKTALTSKIEKTIKSHRSLDEYSSAVNTYELLSDIYKMLTAESAENLFPESSGEYMDYYRTFPSSAADRRLLRRYSEIATAAAEFDFSKLTDTQLREETSALRKQSSFYNGMNSASEARAFALVSEAGYRILGYRHHYVQFLGGAALADGKIAEIHNGEGKTYTIILAAYFHALCGRQVHILDTSEYLAKRNYNWMRGVLELLGLRVGLLINNIYSAADAQKFAQNDVIYSTLRADIFTELSDESSTVPFGIRYDAVIADECDYLMFDEGSLPYALNSSEEMPDELPSPESIYDFVSGLPSFDKELFEITGKNVTVKLGLTELADNNGFDVRGKNGDEINTMIRNCLLSLYVYENNRDYFIVDGKVKFENTSTGKLYDPNYNYIYFISRKEGIAPPEKPVLGKQDNMRTAVDFILSFTHISGTTATASSIVKEIKDIYGLDMISIPPNIPEIRIDTKPSVYINDKGKIEWILQIVCHHHDRGQPVILITGSISESERFGKVLESAGIEHRLVNARSSEDDITGLMFAGEPGAVTVTTAMANRGVDILPGGNPTEMAFQHLIAAGISREQLTVAVYSPDKESPEQIALSEKYKAMLSFYKNKTEEGRNTVLSCGGICVVGTECFDDLRTEQQLRGRTGRQGAPGVSYVIYSFDDSRLKTLLGNGYNAIQSLATDADISSIFLDRAIAKARKKVYFQTVKNKFSIPDLLYYSEARKIIIGTLRDIRSGKYDIRDFIEKYFSSVSENIDALRAMAENKDTDNLSVKLIYPLIADKITKTSDRVLSDLLTDGIYLYLSNAVRLRYNTGEEEPAESLRPFIVLLISKAWVQYLNQISLINQNTNTDSVKGKHNMSEKSKTLYTSLLREIIPRLMLQMLEI